VIFPDPIEHYQALDAKSNQAIDENTNPILSPSDRSLERKNFKPAAVRHACRQPQQ